MSDIRIITAPSVYLIGRPSIDAAALARFLDAEGASGWTTDASSAGETLVEVAGRLCYRSYARPRPGGNSAYIKHILEVGHGSVVEHAVFTLIVTGVSRNLTHELVRHRAGMSYSQLSQRFVDESECAFVCPPALLPHRAEYEAYGEWHRGWATDPASDVMAPPEKRGRALTYGWWLESVANALKTYQAMVEVLTGEFAEITDRTARRKAAREAARSVLPGCTETQICITGNVRAWRHFLELRGSAGADAEIRRLAFAVLDVLKAEAVNLFGDYRIEKTANGIDEIVNEYRKV